MPPLPKMMFSGSERLTTRTDDALDELSGQPRGGGTDQLLIDRIPEQRRSLPVFQILLLYLFKGEKQMKI